MSNIEKFFALLGVSDAVSLDNGALLTKWDSSEVLGNPSNQVARFFWTDGEYDYSETLDEGGIAAGCFDNDGSFVTENTDGNKTVIRFFETNQIEVPHSGKKASALFMKELLGSVESLCGIAEEHGARTLADLMFFQQAVLNGGFVDFYPDESAIMEIVQGLPSGEQWVKFIKVEYMAQPA